MVHDSVRFISGKASHKFLFPVLFDKFREGADPEFVKHAALAGKFAAFPAAVQSFNPRAVVILAPLFACTSFIAAAGAW